MTFANSSDQNSKLPTGRLGILVALVAAYGIYRYSTQPEPPPPSPPLFPVAGNVFVNGKPLDRGMVSFVSDTSKGNHFPSTPRGDIQPDGSYVLTLKGEPGAPAGWYKVVLFATRTPPPPNPTGWKPDWLVDEKYTRRGTTDLTVEVRESAAPGAYDIRATFHPPQQDPTP